MPATKKPTQIAMYPEPELRKKIEKEAKELHRGLGPTVLEIVRRYFAEKEEKRWPAILGMTPTP
jgi:hypothetical protein